MRKTPITHKFHVLSVLLVIIFSNTVYNAHAQRDSSEIVADTSDHMRKIGGTSQDIEADLDNTIPQANSVFRDLEPEFWVKQKKNLYQKHGIGRKYT